jgi:hypothetical protein
LSATANHSIPVAIASSAAKKASVELCVLLVKRTEPAVDVVMLRTASKVSKPKMAIKKMV